MCIKTFSIFLHPCDVVTDALIDIGVGMLSNIDDAVLFKTPTITAGFMVGEPCAVGALTDVLIALIIGAVAATNVDTLDGKNANGLAAVMSPSEFVVPSPWEGPMPFC